MYPPQPPSPPTLQPTNALAGPSKPPVVFLPDPVPERRKPRFTSTDDLLSRFQLLPTYDRYVRPYTTPVMTGGAQAPIDKGKGKEREFDPSTPSVVPAPAAGIEAEDGEPQTKGEKKWRNNYKHLIKDIPGKHSMKKDDYLVSMMQVPPKQRNDIKPFDLRTQRDAFSVSLEGLKGWNINVLVAPSPQAREDRKRRKELKRLAKQAQAQGTPAAPTPGAVSQSAGTPGHPPVRTGTPKPSIVTNRSSVPQPQARGKTPIGVGTPRSVSTPGGPHSAHSTLPTSNSAPQVSTPAPTPNAGPVTLDVKRGVKREREDSSAALTPSNGTDSGTPMNSAGMKPQAVINAKAGMNGVRPRKKQRMQDPQGQPLAVQQPTPRA